MQPVMVQGILTWRAGWQPPPWELMVCPTHRCNLRFGVRARRGEGDTAEPLSPEFPEKRWLRPVEEVAETGGRYLNIGDRIEPIPRRQLVLEICAKVKACGMEGHLQTNGTTLARGDIQAPVALKWDHIKVSLNGRTADADDVVRSGNSCAKTARRIHRLSHLFHQMNFPENNPVNVFGSWLLGKCRAKLSFVTNHIGSAHYGGRNYVIKYVVGKRLLQNTWYS